MTKDVDYFLARICDSASLRRIGLAHDAISIPARSTALAMIAFWSDVTGMRKSTSLRSPLSFGGLPRGLFMEFSVGK
jgi:hypothetical protein